MDSTHLLDKYTRFLLFSVMVIMIVGVIMVYSSSYIYAREIYGTSSYYFLKQLAFLALGVLTAFVVSKTKKSFWFKYAKYIHVMAVFALLLTLFPKVGLSVKGAHRWINLFGFKFQPGEFVKITIVLSSIDFFERFPVLAKKEKILHFASLMFPLLLFLLQPDFGTFSICFILISFVCFISDFPRKIFYSCVGAGIITAIPILLAQPYRVQRLFAFLDPWKNAKGSGFQIIQSYLAFANGSFFGQGLGNSNEKLFYLPEAHNDFIFSVIGEELGFFGVSLTIVLYLFFIYSGFRIALLLKQKLPAMLVATITFIFGLQTFLNMGVVLGLLPTKGLNLPFISYGGSSLIANFFLIGLVLSCVKSRKTFGFDNQAGNFPSQESFNFDSTESSYGGNSTNQSFQF